MGWLSQADMWEEGVYKQIYPSRFRSLFSSNKSILGV